ncbi:hypothetical protein BpHYR1_041494 [Brachionus plicatilis]|uniref:Uncharacterized protein n=1 Tax=Brachionus plicatilis TaxID=10195 RepID=A0A3M7S771_BRAPC|nr:hypothetical protein BpHYR1_041494 [Brachionus plicatilis]
MDGDDLERQILWPSFQYHHFSIFGRIKNLKRGRLQIALFLINFIRIPYFFVRYCSLRNRKTSLTQAITPSRPCQNILNLHRMRQKCVSSLDQPLGQINSIKNKLKCFNMGEMVFISCVKDSNIKFHTDLDFFLH